MENKVYIEATDYSEVPYGCFPVFEDDKLAGFWRSHEPTPKLNPTEEEIDRWLQEPNYVNLFSNKASRFLASLGSSFTGAKTAAK